MRRLAIILLVLLASIWAGIKIAHDPGYVLLSYHQWTIEMPLWMAGVSFFIAFFLLHYIVHFVRHARKFPKRWREKKLQKRQTRSHQLTQEGLLALTTGQWEHAKKKLLKAANYHPLNWLHYIAAGFAAHGLKANEHRDAYWHKASTLSPIAAVIAGITQAQFQLERHPAEAVATLQHIRELAPKQPYILELLANAYVKAEAWDSLFQLLPVLRKQAVLPVIMINNLEAQVYQHLLQVAAHTGITELQDLWRRIPQALRNQPVLIYEFAHGLIEKGFDKEAEELLQKNIPSHWDVRLIQLYGNLDSRHPERQLAIAEKWLGAHPNDINLLLVLGQLCLRNQLWGKARNYLETSISLAPTAKAYQALGRLLEQLGEDKLIISNCYKAGLLLAIAEEPVISAAS